MSLIPRIDPPCHPSRQPPSSRLSLPGLVVDDPSDVVLLGTAARLDWEATAGSPSITLPERASAEAASVFRLAPASGAPSPVVDTAPRPGPSPAGAQENHACRVGLSPRTPVTH